MERNEVNVSLQDASGCIKCALSSVPSSHQRLIISRLDTSSVKSKLSSKPYVVVLRRSQIIPAPSNEQRQRQPVNNWVGPVKPVVDIMSNFLRRKCTITRYHPNYWPRHLFISTLATCIDWWVVSVPAISTGSHMSYSNLWTRAWCWDTEKHYQGEWDSNPQSLDSDTHKGRHSAGVLATPKTNGSTPMLMKSYNLTRNLRLWSD